jgi:ribose 5-phosphate isomerase B
MIIFLAADHAGFTLKENLKDYLLTKSISLVDLSPELIEGDDYPIIAGELAGRILADPQGRGLAVCGSGQGICMGLNRFRGIRAGVADSPEVATLMRKHNDANVLCLAGRFIELAQAKVLLDIFLETEFSQEPRHSRRVQQLDNLGQ